jgi:hypothetical protein
MSVMPWEGTVPILFSMTRVAVGPRIHDAYLTRPDLTGSWPTVVLVAGDPTASTRAFARRLARHGVAVVVPLDGSSRTLDDVASFITNPAADWSSAEHGFGILGVGDCPDRDFRRAQAVALIGCPLPLVSGSVLALYGDDDPAADQVQELRTALPQAEVVLYGGLGAGFHDDAAPGFDDAASEDAVERLVEFFGAALPDAPVT